MPCIVLGMTIHAVFKICISMLSFWIEDAKPFQWLYDKLILVVGTIFPVEIFPAAVQPVLKLTPIYTVCYGPAKLIVDFSVEKYLEILLAQVLYLAFGSVILLWIYEEGGSCMLMAVKNQMRVCALAVKYNIMREMLNKVTFLTNILFMMFNNATFIVQWVILLRLREDVGGYTMREVMLLWGLAASSFGLSHLLFSRVFSLPELIVNGKLDAYLVQPKNVLLSVMTSATSASAIGDFLYGLVLICIFCFSVKRLLLFLLFTVTGALIMTDFALLMGSLTFWFVRAEMLGSNIVASAITFATYPDGIFHGVSRFLLYNIIPVGMAIYHPVHIMIAFDVRKLLAVLGYLVFLSAAAVFVFYRGLRRYSSSSLMQSGRV